jgi:hypothetical protein
MRRVRIDGLVLSSGVRLAGVPGAGSSRPDWTLRVERGSPDARWSHGLQVTGGVRGREGLWAEFARGPAVRAVLVRPWFLLRADPRRGEAVLRHDLPRTEDALVVRRALPYLSALKGRLVLHAAAAAFPAGAVVFCADARTGKSTLALALDAAGCPVLGDDHVALEATPGVGIRAHASVPWVEVAEASVRAFRPDVEAPTAEGPVRLLTAPPPAPVPVAALVRVSRGVALSRRRLSGLRLLPSLLRRFAFVGDPSDRRETAARFDAALRLVSEVSIGSVRVPEGLRALRASLPTLATWWGASPPGG